MREARLFAFATMAAALLAGCSGSPNANALMPSSVAPSTAVHSPMQVLGMLRNAHAKIARDLYVADIAAQTVDILRNKTYRDVGVITGGIGNPNDVFLDARGNLYVANGSGNVAEYAPGDTTSPTFVYNAGMATPDAVTTDAHGNVFEGDLTTGNVSEYFQGSNFAVATCYGEGAGVEGVAVDSSGDVFIDVNEGGIAALIEYAGGLGGGCNPIFVYVNLSNPGGIALDKNKNILAALGNEVAVIPPPYNSISGTIGSGFVGAHSVRLNRTNTMAFVTDSSNNTVTLVSYPGGSNLTVLGTANGLSQPSAAVDWPNAVY
jgi:hypothetical protein